MSHHIFVALLMAGCASSYIPASVTEPLSEDLNASFAAWNSLKLTEYRYQYAKSVPLVGGGPPIYVRVKDRVVVDARYTESGRIWTTDGWIHVHDGDKSNPKYVTVPTIDELFQILNNCQSDCRVYPHLFHPLLGFPVHAGVEHTEIEDSGFGFEIENFEYVPTNGT